MNIVAVVINGGRKQVQKLSVTNLDEVTLGRDWSCDIIVDDPYVDAAHAKLAMNDSGNLQIEDLSSTNGTRINKTSLSGKCVVNVGDSIKLGDSTIQLFDAANEVAPALIRSSGQTFLSKLSSKTGVFITTVLAFSVVLFSIFFGAAEEATLEHIMATLVGMGLLLLTWSLVAGFVGKLFKGETRMPAHWALGCLFLALSIVTIFVTEVVKFNVKSGTVNTALQMSVYFVLLLSFCCLTFSLCTHLSKSKVRVLSGLLSLLALVAIWAPSELEQDHNAWTSWVSSDITNQPAIFLLREPTTLADHLEATSELFTALETEVSDSAAN